MPSNKVFRVLCVDDDKDACEMLTLLLQLEQFEVSCAPSAAEAWPKIKAEPFDLYLLDGWLPKLDGFEFCRQLRESDVHTPIVFYSGAGYETDKRMAFDAGANAYVTKPDIEGLIKTTRDLAAKTKSVAPASWTSGPTAPVKYQLSTQLFGLSTAGTLISL